MYIMRVYCVCVCVCGGTSVYQFLRGHSQLPDVLRGVCEQRVGSGGSWQRASEQRCLDTHFDCARCQPSLQVRGAAPTHSTSKILRGPETARDGYVMASLASHLHFSGSRHLHKCEIKSYSKVLLCLSESIYSFYSLPRPFLS